MGGSEATKVDMEPHLINVIDSPGHVDFCSEVLPHKFCRCNATQYSSGLVLVLWLLGSRGDTAPVTAPLSSV